VTTGLALEGRGDPVAEKFERLMTERIAETESAAVVAPPEGAEPATLETALRFLTSEEVDLLFEPEAVRTYPAGEVVVSLGDRRQAFYVIREGTALVDAGGEAPVYLGPGEVFGELSFLSNEGANASVIAAEDLRVGVLERDRLYRLLERAPDLAGRFYQSLAVLVASRLRAARSQLGSLRPEDVPSRPRPSRADARPDVRERLDALSLGDGAAACEELLGLLAGLEEPEPAGRYALRRFYPLLTKSALLADVLDGTGAVRRDHRAIARMLRNEPEGDGPLGSALDRWALDLGYCRAMRARDAALSTLAGEGDACGLETLPAAGTVVALDADLLAEAAGRGLAGLTANVVHAARGTAPIRLPPQRLIVASGLPEYLSERDLVRLLDWIHAHLAPGGTAAIGAAAAGTRDAPFWEHVLGWRLVRRTTTGLADAFARSEFGVARVDVIADEDAGGLLAVARRAA
jgi:CRP-like cAMP-binding protein